MNSKTYWRLAYIFSFLAVALMFVGYCGYIVAVLFGAVSAFFGVTYFPLKALGLRGKDAE